MLAKHERSCNAARVHGTEHVVPCPSHGCLKKSSQLHCLVGSGWPLLRRASHFLRPILHLVVQEVLPTPTICDIWKRSNANLLSQSTGMDEGAVEDSYIYIYLSLSLPPSFPPSLPPSPSLPPKQICVTCSSIILYLHLA